MGIRPAVDSFNAPSTRPAAQTPATAQVKPTEVKPTEVKPTEVKPTQAKPAAPSSAFAAKTTEVAERLVDRGERADKAHAPARGLGFEDAAPSFGSIKRDQLPDFVDLRDLMNKATGGSFSAQGVFVGARKTSDDRLEVLIGSQPAMSVMISDEERAAKTTYTKFVVTRSGIESSEGTDANGTPKAAPPPVASKPAPQTPTVNTNDFALKPKDLLAFVDKEKQEELVDDMTHGDFSSMSAVLGGRKVGDNVEVLVARGPGPSEMLDDDERAARTTYGVYTVKPDGSFGAPSSVKLAE
jgi:hypothetical protein